MLASFFYQPEVPSAEHLLDIARQALVCCASSDHHERIDEEACEALLDGLSAAYSAALRYENRRADDYAVPTFVDDNAAERAYLKQAQRAYARTVRRAYPDYEPDDESIWWPEGLRLHGGHAKGFVLGLAATLGEIEGDRTVALFRYMAERQEREKGATA